jgi:hypothetical protein
MPLRIPARKWQISAEGFPPGPHEESAVIAWITNGELLEAYCRPTNELKWRKLKEEPRFAQALRRAATTQSIEVPRSPKGNRGGGASTPT